MIPDRHCGDFLKEDDVQFTRNIQWTMSAVGLLVETEHSRPGRVIWEKGIRLYHTVVRIVLLERRSRELCSSAFTVLQGIVDIQLAGRKIQRVQESGMTTAQ